MIWKSNLNEYEKEVIDDFGGKTTVLPTPAEQNASNEIRGAVSKARPQTAAAPKQAASASVQNSEKKEPQM